MITVEQVVRHQDYQAISVHPDTTVAESARIMTDNQWDMVVVCSDTGQVAGVVSWQDIMRAITEISGDISSLKVSQLLTVDPITCSVEDDVHDVLHVMAQHHFHHMPVVKNGHLAGMVRQSDILVTLLEESDMDKRAALIANLKYL
jgi:CBS domain-containing protein